VAVAPEHGRPFRFPRRETVLRLRPAGEALGPLDLAQLTRADRATRRHVALVRTYWDTADGRLAGAGYTLETEDGRPDAVLSARQGLAHRVVWVAPRQGARPDLAAFGPDTHWAALLGDARLRPRVRLRVAGRRWTLRFPGATVEALEGETVLHAGRREVRADGVELRAPAGSGPALLAAAGQLVDAGLCVDPLGAARRAHGVAAGEAPAPVKATVAALDRHGPALDGLLAMGATALEQIALNWEPAFAGADTEGVHQLRVGLRRLRTALSLFRPLLPEAAHGDLVAAVRRLNRIAAPVRDWDVFRAETLAPIADAAIDAPALAALDAAVSARSEAARAALRGALAGPEGARLLLTLTGWFEGGLLPRSDPQPEDRPATLGAYAGEDLARRHRKLIEHGEALGEHPAAPALHALRLRTKKVRYTADGLRTLFRKDLKGYRRRLASLQQALGRVNDAASAADLLDDLVGAAAPAALHRAAGIVLGWTAAEGRRHRRDVAKAWRRLAARDPAF